MEYKRPGQSNPLLHSTGQFVGVVVLKALQSYQTQHLTGFIPPVCSRYPAAFQAEFHIIPGGQPLEEGRSLKYYAPLGRRFRYQLFVQQNISRYRRVKSGYDVQQ